MKVGFEASVGLQKRWTNCEKEIDKLLYREKIMWMQRSHIAWLREGDRNTKYFRHVGGERKTTFGSSKVVTEPGPQIQRKWRTCLEGFSKPFTRGINTSSQALLWIY
jgi:hypothetical protein